MLLAYIINSGSPVKRNDPIEWLGIDNPAKRWEQFLLEIFNDNKETVDFMHRLSGQAIIGKVTEVIFPILWGEGRNGKGTLLETIKLVSGDLAGPLPSESLLEQKFTQSGGAPSPDIMMTPAEIVDGPFLRLGNFGHGFRLR